MKKAKYAIILLSYVGVGLMGNLTGAERRSKKRTNNFWYKFVFQTIGWSILLFVLPGVLYRGIICPNINCEETLMRTFDMLFVLYIYCSGVFICWWQIRLREKDV